MFCVLVVGKQSSNGIEDLEGLRQQIAQLQAETSDGLKKNVYKHYHQFIETAKEISSELSFELLTV
jgi:Vps51/Vps67